jgi:hypothetical protein
MKVDLMSLHPSTGGLVGMVWGVKKHRWMPSGCPLVVYVLNALMLLMHQILAGLLLAVDVEFAIPVCSCAS